MHPFPLIVPSPVRPGGHKQIKPSGELIHVALSTQLAAGVEHSSAV